MSIVFFNFIADFIKKLSDFLWIKRDKHLFAFGLKVLNLAVSIIKNYIIIIEIDIDIDFKIRYNLAKETQTLKG